ncbi:MAG: GDYXXLXY domain-containing protein [Pseudomonadota bacterium]
MNITMRIGVIIALLTVSLLGMVAMKQWTLNTGTPILLETRPVDPRSLFRGDYVRLNYVISDLDLEILRSDDDFQRHERVYVLLQEGERYWTPVSIHHTMPPRADGQVAIRGTVHYVQNTRWNQETQKTDTVRNLRVRYGIENYFVPEGKGRELERRPSNGKVEILIAVDSFGNAGIKAVLLNGEEKYRESLL